MRVDIPRLYVGINTRISWWPCNYSRDGYMPTFPDSVDVVHSGPHLEITVHRDLVPPR